MFGVQRLLDIIGLSYDGVFFCRWRSVTIAGHLSAFQRGDRTTAFESDARYYSFPTRHATRRRICEFIEIDAVFKSISYRGTDNRVVRAVLRLLVVSGRPTLQCTRAHTRTIALAFVCGTRTLHRLIIITRPYLECCRSANKHPMSSATKS